MTRSTFVLIRLKLSFKFFIIFQNNTLLILFKKKIFLLGIILPSHKKVLLLIDFQISFIIMVASSGWTSWKIVMHYLILSYPFSDLGYPNSSKALHIQFFFGAKILKKIFGNWAIGYISQGAYSFFFFFKYLSVLMI